MKSWPFLVCALISLAFLPLYTATATTDCRDGMPSEWWMEVNDAPGWEIVPQDAGPCQVVLSKRTELGIFSNFGESPFVLDGTKYRSIEGLWQALKYPEPAISDDPRHAIDDWPHTRAEVKDMYAWDAKDAGNMANRIYYDNDLIDVSYQGYFFDYVDRAEGSQYHYELITRAMYAKVTQNPWIKELLLQTGDLELLPDHYMSRNVPASFNYHKILMKLRDELRQ